MLVVRRISLAYYGHEEKGCNISNEVIQDKSNARPKIKGGEGRRDRNKREKRNSG